jgi:hypothetical protein
VDYGVEILKKFTKKAQSRKMIQLREIKIMIIKLEFIMLKEKV